MTEVIHDQQTRVMLFLKIELNNPNKIKLTYKHSVLEWKMVQKNYYNI